MMIVARCDEISWSFGFTSRHLTSSRAGRKSTGRKEWTEGERDSRPFCLRVRRAIDILGLDVELRNIYEDRAHFDELREARGRTTVPVLRITSPDGDERWMPESADIVRYLQATYGEVAA